MRFAREQIIFRALLALEEVRQLAHRGPVEPTRSLDCALLVLRAFTARRDAVADFRQAMQETNSHAHHEMGSYLRTTRLQTNMNAIMLGLGFHPTVALDQCLGATYREPDKLQQHMAAFWSEVAEQLDDGRRAPRQPEWRVPGK